MILADESDGPKVQKKMAESVNYLEDLIRLGLLMELTDKLPDHVAHAKQEHGNDVRYFCVSYIGSLMFTDSGKRPIN